MVSLFYLGLLFLIMIHIALMDSSSAYAHQYDQDNSSLLSGGRKMMMMMREENNNIAGGAVAVAVAGIPKISGASHDDIDGSNCGGQGIKRGFSHVKCNKVLEEDHDDDDQKNITSTRDMAYTNKKVVVVAGFVAFNADYHGPKRHPPKHN
ncbi:uncharacterized protein LOC115700292 isoform X1 [Cannabis sativa]|uniref:uncharacterized protein LOC115700292 isoform X1 n=1 Tax=Cannabis sativa TaxID=3483 RepID=UPI0029CA60CF|nr:uncharacterized protein LOC115700292 isoform X1 [Cannabis sativa]